MERPILLLFERRQLIIPQRQPFSSSTVFAPFIDSRARMSSRVCFWASPPGVKDIGGVVGGANENSNSSFSHLEERNAGLANRAATLTSTVSTKPNEREWRNTTTSFSALRFYRRSRLVHTFLSLYIRVPTTLYCHVVALPFPLDTHSGEGGG